ncbi:MAG: shikimate dehydrogenase family protein [Caulobacteraceae bacterium]
MSAPRRYAVIGDPVSHSLSPLMHNGWIADHGINATYEALQLKSDDPVASIRALTGYSGANVTVPYKEAAAKVGGWVEGDVANVLRWEEDGSISCINTDGDGFRDAMDEGVPDWLYRVSNALVIGAGGAAQAIALALEPSVGRLTFINRTQARADAAASGLALVHADVLPWAELERGFAWADLVVQATTLGMKGQPAPDWPVVACKAGAIVADIVYNPLETTLLGAARSRGLVTVDGLGMLIYQGARSFQFWFGIWPDVVKARARLEAALA